MANPYKDREGHWTTKENDGGPCKHSDKKHSTSIRDGKFYFKENDDSEELEVSRDEWEDLRGSSKEELFDENNDDDFGFDKDDEDSYGYLDPRTGELVNKDYYEKHVKPNLEPEADDKAPLDDNDIKEWEKALGRDLSDEEKGVMKEGLGKKDFNKDMDSMIANAFSKGQTPQQVVDSVKYDLDIEDDSEELKTLMDKVRNYKKEDDMEWRLKPDNLAIVQKLQKLGLETGKMSEEDFEVAKDFLRRFGKSESKKEYPSGMTDVFTDDQSPDYDNMPKKKHNPTKNQKAREKEEK